MHQSGAPMIPQQGMQGPPRFGQTQSQWAGQPRQSGPRPALLNGPPQRPQMVNQQNNPTILQQNNRFCKKLIGSKIVHFFLIARMEYR